MLHLIQIIKNIYIYIYNKYSNNEQNSIIEYYIDNSESIDFENFPNLSNIEKM